MDLIKKILPDERETEERFEQIRHDAIHKADKDISGIGNEVRGQVTNDLLSSLYGPSEKKSQPSTSSGTASAGEQLTFKPGEMFSDIAGAPAEPGQTPASESAIGQITIPAPEIIGAMTGSPVEAEENSSTESGIEQVLPTAGQVIGHMTGSIQQERVTPHMETASEQIIPSIDDFAANLGITAIGQSSPTEGHEPGQQAPQGENNQQPSTVDANMQMSADEKARYTDDQKTRREHQMLHEREYRKFGTPLDDIGTLEEQVSKVRQQKEQEEQQKLQEEEEEKKRKEEEEKQQQQELAEPTTKPKPGQMAVDQGKKGTEIHRGKSG